ncbi:MAG: exodeoxyribonuclease VII large subunit [Clostridia bacterium]|nr:exodeoxyribonuclease VII large subunit [Clostridia bacterium]
MPNERPILTVTQLNEYVKGIIDSDKVLAGLSVKGEISNFTAHKTGHLYFTIKDESSLIRAVMFRSAAAKLRFAPENGLKIIATGRVSAFVRDGSYQVYVDSLQPDGVGELTVAYEQLKKKLQAEGLFDPAKKKKIPRYPSRVGVITSPTGAAVRDIVNVLSRRFPYAKMVLYPSLVQGAEAAPQLIAGLRYFNETRSADVIIIGRGGGSIEDLWAFNSEELAREVYASEIPVISAVGHEIDFTICDFVADLRAPTPSAAAEMAVPETRELIRKINNVVGHMQVLLDRGVKLRRQNLAALADRPVFNQPMLLLDGPRMTLISDTQRIVRAMEKLTEEKKRSFAANAAKLEALSPMAVLLRGYSAAFTEKGKLIRSVEDANVGDKLALSVSDGTIYTEVIGKETKNHGNLSE